MDGRSKGNNDSLGRERTKARRFAVLIQILRRYQTMGETKKMTKEQADEFRHNVEEALRRQAELDPVLKKWQGYDFWDILYDITEQMIKSRHAQDDVEPTPAATLAEMIARENFQQRRSPRAFRDFVVILKEAVEADTAERHRGILKKGLYKEFLDEIVPLSIFALEFYPENYGIQWENRNQKNKKTSGYDALVFDETGKETD